MQILTVVKILSITFFLTIITQVGGIVYLVSFATYRAIKNKFKNNVLRSAVKFMIFLTLYIVAVLIIVPVVAPVFGRVPLPLIETNNLRPLTLVTCVLNRHYVRPELRTTAFEVAKQMNEKTPGTIINYLDANFPFMNDFPLFPHLSHRDGKKLDISFMYTDARSGVQTNTAPSFIGYGVSEEPRSDEVHIANDCAEKGYWQYGLLTAIIPQDHKQYFTFDSLRTKNLVLLFSLQPKIGKIFIEPHLKTRLALTSEKIRFHGCQAVRHDDHIHVQLQ